jgi:ketosteroid isomerase-like protein
MAAMTEKKAQRFAREWIAAWNAHDLDRILSHHDEGVVFASALAVELAGAADAVVRGKPQLRAYFAGGLEAFPALRFEPIAAPAWRELGRASPPASDGDR